MTNIGHNSQAALRDQVSHARVKVEAIRELAELCSVLAGEMLAGCRDGDLKPLLKVRDRINALQIAILSVGTDTTGVLESLEEALAPGEWRT